MGKMKKILVVSIGGTISMTKNKTGGIVSNVSIESILKTVPNISSLAIIDTICPFICPASSIQLEKFLSLIIDLEKKLNSDYDGALIIQGTDTIEETSFLIDILIKTNKPIVVTGAMRGHDMLSADGPSNLYCSLMTLLHPDTFAKGTLVVLNETIHSARFVIKTDTSKLDAFKSPSFGPIGSIIEGKVIFFTSAYKKININIPSKFKFGKIPILTFGIGDDPKLFEAASKIDYDGFVLQATGAGHIPSSIVPSIAKVTRHKPVVLSTRVLSGKVFNSTYGFPGSEIDLIKKGVITSGFLNAPKSRILLSVLTGCKLSHNKILNYFQKF